LLDSQASGWERVGAGVSLASEILPVSIGDVKDVGRVLGVIDDVADRSKQIAKQGDDAVIAAKKVHGNTAGSQPAELYEKYDSAGNFEKHGVSQDAGKRYTKAEIAGGEVRVVDRGPRKEMLQKERDRVETNPGPKNQEPWAGKRKRDDERNQ
jgi:hypothetical protein